MRGAGVSEQQHEHLRLMLLMASIILALCVGVTVAKAQPPASLPEGVSCDTVWYYAKSFNIPDTRLGRLRAKGIALMLGFQLTDAQLEAARQCIQSKRDLQ